MTNPFSKYLQKKLLEEKKAKLPNPKQHLNEFSRYFQQGILLLNITIILLFCSGFAISFTKKINGDSTSSKTSNEVDILVCFPDLKEDWEMWLALVFYELSALLDLISSLSYFNTLTCNWKWWFTYAKHCSPIYSVIAALQSVWIQKASLNCADSDSGIIFNFASVFAGIQSVTIIVCILQRIVESKYCCCFEKSCKKYLEEILKFVCALLQIVTVGWSLYTWFSKIVSMPFTPFWLEWPVLIFFPLWMLVRVVEYVINLYVHEQEEEKDEPKRQFELANQQGSKGNDIQSPTEYSLISDSPAKKPNGRL